MKIIEIKDIDLEEQLNKVLECITINEQLILSRCSLCNTILETIEKSEVEGKVPRKVFDNNNKFWFCYKCNKFYWKGSHYDKILSKINRIKKRKAQK